MAEKQLELGKRVKLQAGLQAYISLHCVEASSLVISTSGSDSTTFGCDSKPSGLVLKVSGCDSRPYNSNLTVSGCCDSKPSSSDVTVYGYDSKPSGLQVSGCDSTKSGSHLTASGCDSKPSGCDSKPSGLVLEVSVCDSTTPGCDSELSGCDSTTSGSGLATVEPDIRKRGQNYAQMAKELGDIAYGIKSDEAKVFEKICQQWNSTPSSDLFSVVQESITKLRDTV